MNAAVEETSLHKALRLGGTLFLVTAVTGLVLGGVERGTRTAILKARMTDQANALRNVMPEAETFKAVDVAPEGGTIVVTGAQEALKGDARVGYCLTVSTKGYGGPISMVVGLKEDGSVSAIRILTHAETPGLGAHSAEPAFYRQFDNRTTLPLKVVKGASGAGDEISAISGATITSTAVTAGVNAAADYWSRKLKGGESR